MMREMDMLRGPLLKKIIIFALPLGLSSILQQLFNSADVLVVGRFASSRALAAVGANSSVISLVVTAITGLSIGANVLVAQHIGRKNENLVNKAVHSIMAMALIFGVIALALGLIFSRMILEAMNTPADVIDMATVYLRIYMLGMPFIVIYNFGSAILRSIGDSSRPLYCLIVSGVLNVILNLFFVIVCHMTSDGVALATTISNVVSSAMVLYFLVHESGMLHLTFKKIHLNGQDLKSVLKIGGPAALQGMVFSFSNIIIQSAINSFGSNAVAAVSAALNFETYCYYVANAFAQTAVTFTSQNYAAGEYDRCKKVFRLTMTCGFLFTTLLSVIFIIFRYPLIRVFTTDPKVIRYGVARMMMVTTFEALTSTYEVPGSCLRGMGYSMLAALITVFGSCVLRLIFIATYFQSHHSFSVLCSIYPITWVITGTMMFIAYFYYRRRLWHN